MSEKVVSIKGGFTADPRIASENVVRELEWVLERAKNGEIVGIAASFRWFDGSSGSVAEGHNGMAVVGELFKLAQTIGK